MNKIYLFALGLLASASAMAQDKTPADNVGIGTIAPDKSAILDISSSKKGILLPRMTQKERDAIAAPAKGLLVFQTDANTQGFYFYNGTQWSPMSSEDAKSVAATNGAWTKDGDDISAETDAFIGTTSNHPLTFKVNNIKSGFIDNTGATGNTAFGFKSSELTLSPSYYNSSFGFQSLTLNTTGNQNAAFGALALQKNTSGSTNLGIGTAALRDNTIGNGNVAVGGYALGSNTTGNTNVAVGNDALAFNTSGSINTAIGFNALSSNTTGSSNLALANGALVLNTTGSNNVAFGSNALHDNTTGNNNLALGARSGYSVIGTGNIFVGSSAGEGEPVATSNTLIIGNTISTATSQPFIKGDIAANRLKINSKTAGFLAVGDWDAATPMPTPTGYRLIVQDGVLTEKIKVALRSSATDWADYVFEPSYKAKMLSLEEIEKFTISNKHLPNVPSSEQMVKDGLDVGKTSKMFMEKIEELTLYMIEMNKEIKALKAENAKFKK
jgi:trimeric autotransporter adhesin